MVSSAWCRPLKAQEREDGSYDPSVFTLCFKAPKYVAQELDTKYTGTKPILVICTDDGKLKMANEKVFNSGNHPVEMFVPMLHFRDAGFSFEIATTTGGPVVLEMWAYPKDENVKILHDAIRSQMEKPKKTSEIANLDNYSAIFIPGGHGAMCSIPTDADVGRLLHEAHTKELPTVTLCHGPAALLSTKENDKTFAYEGYEAVCFPAKVDDSTPSFGYLPGHVPWHVQDNLQEAGMTIPNTSTTGAVKQDRELITGDSPDASQNLGVFAAPILVKHAMEHQQK